MTKKSDDEIPPLVIIFLAICYVSVFTVAGLKLFIKYYLMN